MVQLFQLVLGPFDYVHFNASMCRSGSDIPILQSLGNMQNFLNRKVSRLHLLMTTEFLASPDFEAFPTLVANYLKVNHLEKLECHIISSMEEIKEQSQYLIKLDPRIFLAQQDLFQMIDSISAQYNTPFTGQTYLPRFLQHMSQTPWFTFWYLTIMYWIVEWQGWLGFRYWNWFFFVFDASPIMPSASFVPQIRVERLLRESLLEGSKSVASIPSKDDQPLILRHSYFMYSPEMVPYVNPHENDHHDPRFVKQNHQHTAYLTSKVIAAADVRPNRREILGIGYFFLGILMLALAVGFSAPELSKITLKLLGTPLSWLFGTAVYFSLLGYIRYRWLKAAFYGRLVGPQSVPLPRGSMPSVDGRYISLERTTARDKRLALSELWSSLKLFFYFVGILHFTVYYVIMWLVWVIL